MAPLRARSPRWTRLVLGAMLLLPTSGLRAEEAAEHETPLRPGLFVTVEQSGAWVGGGPAEAWTAPRLGWRQPGEAIDWSLELGPRFVGAERTDWAAKLELA